MGYVVLKALDDFKPRKVDAWVLEDAFYREQLHHQIMYHPSFVLPNCENPAVICGFVTGPGNVAEAWMITGEGFEENIFSIIRQQKRLIEDMMEAMKWNRLHMTVVDGRPEADKYARLLGFEFEASLSKMGFRGEALKIYVMPEKGEK